MMFIEKVLGTKLEPNMDRVLESMKLTFNFKANEARALLLYINGQANDEEKKLVRKMYLRLDEQYRREIEG